MKIAFYTLKGLASVITDPYFLFLLFILGINFYKKNRKTVIMQKMIIGNAINSPLELTLSQIVLGLLGGFLGSLILNYLGVIFPDNLVIYMLFLLSIILMFINSKYICFSYSGALLGIIIILLEFVNKTFQINISVPTINIVSLVTLIGVMHIVEGFLVMIDGSKGAIPIFAHKEDKIIGGFALNRYWSVPIILIIFFANKEFGIVAENIASPKWWPIINSEFGRRILEPFSLIFLPFYSVIGYNTVTFTKSKKKKSLVSGILIILYGITISFIAQLAEVGKSISILVLLFTSLLHEAMLYLDTYIELKGEAKFMSNEQGIMVLEVAPNSPAEEMGIESGDVLVEVNNKSISSEKEIFENLIELQNFLWLKVKKKTGEIKELYYNKMNNTKKLGVVCVPKHINIENKLIKVKRSNFKDILEKIKNEDKNK